MVAENSVLDQSKLELVNRKQLNITGIGKVLESSVTKISAAFAKSTIQIIGNNLHINKLDISSGIMEIDGEINEIKFSDGATKGGLLKRIFK